MNFGKRDIDVTFKKWWDFLQGFLEETVQIFHSPISHVWQSGVDLGRKTFKLTIIVGGANTTGVMFISQTYQQCDTSSGFSLHF